MRTIRLFAAVCMALLPTLPAAAQSGYGDTSLSYKDGVVWDDDTVPGGGLNQSFLYEEQTSSGLLTVERGFRSESYGVAGPQSEALIDPASAVRERPTAQQRIQ